MIRAFTQCDAHIDATKGGRFQMYGGNVCGEFSELVCQIDKLEMLVLDGFDSMKIHVAEFESQTFLASP